MLSTTSDDSESDDSRYLNRRKIRRQRQVSSSSTDSDNSVIARHYRRKKCRVSSSSSDSDGSSIARPAKKKCRVLSESGSNSTATSDEEEERMELEEEILRRQRGRCSKKVAVSSSSEACSDNGVVTTTQSSPKAQNPVADVNSSDSEEGEKCIICFKSLKPPFAHPSNCNHRFHPNCLATWTKTSNTCPIDRVQYTEILTVDHNGARISRERVSAPPPQDHNADFEPDDATFCEICSHTDREHEMLLCDRCEAGYHLDCLTPPLREVPEGNWFCPRCTHLGNELAAEMNVLMDDAAIILESRMRQRSANTTRMPSRPRTRGAQRVFNIIHHQQATDQPSTSSVTIRRHRTNSHRTRRSKSSRRPQSTRYKVELITVEDGTTLEVKVAVNTRTKSKKHSRRKSKKKCSKSSHKSGGGPSTSRDTIFTGEGPSHSLDLFGSRPQFDYFSGCEAEDELDEDGGRGGGVDTLRRVPRPGVRNMANRKQIAAQILNAHSRRQPPRIEVSRAPVDLVSSIIEQQEKWHSPGASYESTSNGDIRVIMKERSNKIRQAGGSSSGSPGNAPSTSTQTSSSSSQPSRNTGALRSGSAGGSRETPNTPQPSSVPSSRICDDGDDFSTASKTSGSSERVPSPKTSSSSELDRDEKDNDERSQRGEIREKEDTDIPLQSTSNPNPYEHQEETSDAEGGKASYGLPSTHQQHEPTTQLGDTSQEGSAVEENESDCPTQGTYSKISQDIAEKINYSENSGKDYELPPSNDGSVNSVAEAPVEDQRVPEDLSMKKTTDDNREVESDIMDDKSLGIVMKTNFETKNDDVECDDQSAACVKDGSNDQEEAEDEPEDLTMVDGVMRRKPDTTDVQNYANETKVADEKENRDEHSNTNLDENMAPKEEEKKEDEEATDEVGEKEKQDVYSEKDDITSPELHEQPHALEECEVNEGCTSKNDVTVQVTDETSEEVGQSKEAEFENEQVVADAKQDEHDAPSLNVGKETPDGTTQSEDIYVKSPPSDDVATSMPEAGNEQDVAGVRRDGHNAPSVYDGKETPGGTTELKDIHEKSRASVDLATSMPEAGNEEDVAEAGNEEDVADVEQDEHNAPSVNDGKETPDGTTELKDILGKSRASVDLATSIMEADNEEDVADVKDEHNAPSVNDGNEAPDGAAEMEDIHEKSPASDDLAASMPGVGIDDPLDDTKSTVVEASLSELSDGELADEEATEEGSLPGECDPQTKTCEEDPVTSFPRVANLIEPCFKDDGDNRDDTGDTPLYSRNENQDIRSEYQQIGPKIVHADKPVEENYETETATKISNPENEQGGDLLEIGCEEEKDGLVDITDEEISSYERSWEMEENGGKNKTEGLEGLETEAISDCESQPVEADVLQRKDIEERVESHPTTAAIEEGSREEEGEIVTEDGSPLHRKKITSERNYRGDLKTKEKKKGSVQNDDKQPELERYDARRVITEKPRKKVGDLGRDISSDSDSTSLSSSIGRSISREQISRSKSRSRSRGRVKERPRDRARDRSRDYSKSRSRERNKVRSISREKNRRNRSRSRKRRRSRTPRRDRGRSRNRDSRDRRKRKRSPSSSCTSCSCSSCEREKKRNKKLTVIVPNEGNARDRSRGRGKNKKDRRRSRSRNRKRRTPVPSKEVFTSGNNILVSVNFKSSNAEEAARNSENAPPSKRKKDDDVRKKKDKRSKENQPMRSIVTKKNQRRKINTSNMKPVAIIDLDASPFRETTLSPKEIIILTDSDEEDKLAQTESVMQMSGPKTPPEPHIKFSIANNSKQQQQLRGIPNPLLDKAGREDDDDDVMHIGPNTPPEPSAPYDPFEPTKSRSPSPGPTSRSDRIPSPTPEAKQRHSPLQSQISLTPPKLSQHDSPKTPSPLQSMPKEMDALPEKNKQLPFQPAGLDSGDDSGGGGGGDSPYSPGSSEGDDLFEPPSASVPKPRPRPQAAPQSSKAKAPPPKVTMSTQKRSNNLIKETTKKGPVRKEMGMKLDEDQLKILDDLPNSAVEMQVKDKFLKKLNRQERVVEEVKLVLKPHYAKKHVSKEEYKEILRRSVPKICHSRSGEINPMKIQRLIEAYVKKYRHRMKRKGGAPAIQPLRQNKPATIKTQWA